MNRIFAILWFIWLMAVASAPENAIEPAILECRYLETVVVDTLSGRSVGDTLILKVGRTASAFYSKDLLFKDSLMARPDGQQEFRRLMLRYAKEGRISELTSNTSEYIYQNWPKGFIIARNLLNRKSFSSVRSTDLIEYSTTRAIRPASLTLKILFNLK